MLPMQFQKCLKDAHATDEFGHRLASVLVECLQSSPKLSYLIYLQGQLGAGKTSLVRACLRALGVEGPIKSPTYTLLEPYEVKVSANKALNETEVGLKIAHLDLYRLQEPEELDYIGGRDLKDNYQLIFVEWPDKAQGFISEFDINIQLNHRDKGRDILIESKLTPIINALNH